MKKKILLPLALGFLLAACSNSDVRGTLGLNRNAPDEFTVVSRPPLTVPPDFDLRPPKPGAAPRGTNTENAAKAALLGDRAKPASETSLPDELPKTETAVVPVIASDAPTGAQAGFLKKARADAADEDIRNKLGADALRKPEDKPARSLLDKLSKPESNEPVVDAKKEAERLRSNKDAGKPVTEGDVPEEKVKPPTVWDRIF